MTYLYKFAPFLSAGLIQAALALVIALGWKPSVGVTGGIEAVAAALLALLTAAQSSDVTVALVSGLLTAVGTLLVAFAVPHVSTGLVSAFNVFFTALAAIYLHTSVPSKAKIKALAAQSVTVKASAA